MAPRRKKSPTSINPRDRSERGKHRREADEKIEIALRDSSLPDTLQAKYRETLNGVLDAMQSGAVARFCGNVEECRFYKTHSELTAAIQAKYPALKVRGILKGCFDRDGVLHLDGGGSLFGRKAKLSEFHAHEIAHAIDGNDHEISNSEAWRAAWEAESGLLSDNGRSRPSEGFAEFGEMLLGAGIGRAQMKDAMPSCLNVWEEYEL